MKHSFLILSVASAFFLGACNNNTAPKNQESTEAAKDVNEQKFDENNSMENAADFLVKVADNGMLEVELGKLAEKKGQMAEVKSFGKMMVEHHTKLNTELKTLAAAKNITLPGSLSEESRDKLNKLSEKSGKDFDEAYIDAMEDDHEKDVKDFENKADNKKWDADITAWLSNSLPTLRSHLAEIERIDDKFDAMKK
jgi:putative membrane protein